MYTLQYNIVHACVTGGSTLRMLNSQTEQIGAEYINDLFFLDGQ